MCYFVRVAARGCGGSYARRARNCPQRAARGVGCGVGAIFSRLFCVIVACVAARAVAMQRGWKLQRMRTVVPLRALIRPIGDILLFALRLVHQRARASFGSCENVLLLDAARLPEPWLQCDLVYDFFMDPRRVSMPTAATSTSARLQP